MKKIFVLSLLVLGFTSAQAQWYKKGPSVKGNGVLVTEERDISTFAEVSVGGAVDVYIHKANEHRVEVTTDENIIEYVKTDVKNGALVIKTEANLRKYKELIVNIYTPDFHKLDVSGACDLWVKGDFKSETLSISGSGACNIYADNINAKNVVIKASGATDMTVGGKCDDLKIHSSGSSDVMAKKLSTHTASVHASGASDISVMADGKIHGGLSGSSDLEYYGKPSAVEVSTSGASDVSKGE